MNQFTSSVTKVFTVAIWVSTVVSFAAAHEHTLPAARKRERDVRQRLLAQVELDVAAKKQLGVCRLAIELADGDTGQPVPGNVRITNTRNGEALALTGLIVRPNHWYALPGRTVVSVPQGRLSISAFRGTESRLAVKVIDLRGKDTASARLGLRSLYRRADRRLVSGNTHLHLNRLSRREADRYLTVVPRADDLDLLYVSHLRRAIDDETYITNEYAAEDLARLSSPDVTLRHGQEHRHNFDAYGEGYGHVMMLDIKRLIEPVSIGPGLMKTGSDGVPLRRGIDIARNDDASVIWCHNSFGLEDLPNWMSGRLHALNIFDGGDHGSYKDTYYRYLNIGINVPFSTGTDWFVYDLSRVYVPLDEPHSSSAWLKQLASGRSYITNGTLLEFQTADHRIGDTIPLTGPGVVEVSGRGIGRNDFKSIELVYNGQVVHSVKSTRHDDHYNAAMKFDVNVDGPGWIALRVSLEAEDNEFGHTLFAHTSPIYFELAGKRIFHADIAQQLLVEMERSVSQIKSRGVFANEEEREAVLAVHRQGMEDLKHRMQRGGQE